MWASLTSAEVCMATRLEVIRRWHLLSPYLDRRERSWWAAAEAEVIGYGGRVLLTNITGISTAVISARIREFGPSNGAPAGSLAHHPPHKRGAGRRFVELTDPDIEPALE